MKRVFLGIKGHVVCLNKHTGDELWRTKLKSDWGKPTIVVYSENLFAYVSGILFCLDANSGKTLWQNKLKGLGSGPCVISVEGKTSLGEHEGTEGAMLDVIEAAVDVTIG